MKILVTGGAGYVGSGLLRVLLKAGHHVVCVDKLMFGGESILDIWHEPGFEFHRCDINDHAAFGEILRKQRYDFVIHLAAIVGDPACKREPELATRTNWDSSKFLADQCVALRIPRLAFASTCSNYGKMADSSQYVREESTLAPVSLYAELKVKFERYLLEQLPKSATFSPVALRFATVYGISPRMRFDLTVNEFTKDVALGRELVIFGEQFWRPYCHVRDFSRAFTTVMEAPKDKIAYNVYNVGDTRENYTKQMLVEEIQKQNPSAKVKYVPAGDDPRDYRVNCDKIQRELGFKITARVADGVREITRIVQEGIIADPEDQRYYNIPHRRP